MSEGKKLVFFVPKTM